MNVTAPIEPSDRPSPQAVEDGSSTPGLIRNQKVLVGFLVIALAIGYLVTTSISNASVYYLTIPEYKAGITKGMGQQRVNGKVQVGSIEMAENGLGATFLMIDPEDPSQSMPVIYKGVVPDTFKDESDVVVEGKINQATGFFEATMLLAKCPSKFTAE